MHTNGVQQTTATTGTGNLTLVSVAGYPTFADVVPLNFPFEYAALDSGGKLLETGIGYLSSSTVLVRAKICATYSGGTYNDKTPTAASLTGTTTIIGTSHAATLGSAGFGNVDAQSASLNRFLTTAHRNLSFSNLTLTANRQYYVPFKLESAIVLASLSINVTTGVASTTARVGLYTCNEKGYMGGIIAGNASALDTSTTGVKTETLSANLFLPAGWYYVSAASSGAPAITGHAVSAANVMGGGPLGFSGTSAVDFRYEALAGGFTSLADPANTTTTAQAIGSFGCPVVYLGAAA